MAKRPDPEWRVIGAALSLAESEGWRRVGLAGIAQKAGLSLAETYAIFPNKLAIIGGFARRIDRVVLEGGDLTDGDDSIRDKLFELLMRRFEAMRPHRAGLKSVLQEMDPLAGLCTLNNLRLSMSCMLEAAGVPAGGLAGRLKSKGLGLVYLLSFRVWLGDESKDLAPTMAALDKGLARVEQFAMAGPLGRA